MTIKGALVAATVAGLFAAAPAVVRADGAKKGGSVNCTGANECKGKSACKTAASSCKGTNACKGKGWVTMTEEECKKHGGTVAPAGK